MLVVDVGIQKIIPCVNANSFILVPDLEWMDYLEFPLFQMTDEFLVSSRLPKIDFGRYQPD